MRRHSSEHFEHCGIARRHLEECRCFQVPLDGNGLTQAGDCDLDHHTRLVRVLLLVHVGPVLFQRDVAPPLSRETGYTSGQSELQSVNHTTLSRAVWTTSGKTFPLE